ncbi:hypothetical protein JOQ06_023701 [Pogonophryne albipinna]|uniref:Uncharacterized protein n=1 Tax=Pogonophryne albipinna TaxID=1090488 RepID=A0AAD6FUK1_9TELE|nr:hypothetical protein JOQ06_023701 [Pogonophryne albipinna]
MAFTPQRVKTMTEPYWSDRPPAFQLTSGGNEERRCRVTERFIDMLNVKANTSAASVVFTVACGSSRLASGVFVAVVSTTLLYAFLHSLHWLGSLLWQIYPENICLALPDVASSTQLVNTDAGCVGMMGNVNRRKKWLLVEASAERTVSTALKRLNTTLQSSVHTQEQRKK